MHGLHRRSIARSPEVSTRVPRRRQRIVCGYVFWGGGEKMKFFVGKDSGFAEDCNKNCYTNDLVFMHFRRKYDLFIYLFRSPQNGFRSYKKSPLKERFIVVLLQRT